MAKVVRNVHVWLRGDEIDLLEDWRRRQEQIPSMAAATRALIRRGIEASAADRKKSSAKDNAA